MQGCNCISCRFNWLAQSLKDKLVHWYFYLVQFAQIHCPPTIQPITRNDTSIDEKTSTHNDQATPRDDSSGNNHALAVDSLVVVNIDGKPVKGVIKWMGTLRDIPKMHAGVELVSIDCE